MTVTRLWQAGIETGDMTEFYVATASATTAQKKTGSYSMGCSNGTLGVVAVPATRLVRCGFFFNPGAYAVTTESNIFWIRDISNNELVAVEIVGTGGGSNMILEVAGTNQDTAVGISTPSTWFHVGVDIKVDSSAGWAYVYKDGVEVLSFSGNTGNADITSVVFGCTGSDGTMRYWDDMFVGDSTGEVAAAVVDIRRFAYLSPDGNGNYNGNWLGSDSNTTDNYALVDEIPAASADYISTTVTATTESFTMGTYTLGTNETIVAVIEQASCQKSGLTEQLTLGARYSGTDNIGSALDLSTSWMTIQNRQTTKPGGGAWDQTALSGFELVLKTAGTF